MLDPYAKYQTRLFSISEAVAGTIRWEGNEEGGAVCGSSKEKMTRISYEM